MLSNTTIELKKEFLKTCKVITCKSLTQNKKLQKVTLVATSNLNDLIDIEKMEYTYNPTTNEIVNNTIYYNKSYQVKKIEINYKELNLKSNYKFKKANKYVVDKKNQPLTKYVGYEIVDNRKH